MRTEIHIDLSDGDATVEEYDTTDGKGITIAVGIGEPHDTVIVLENTEGILERTK